MNLLPAWRGILERPMPVVLEKERMILPKDPKYFQQGVQFVNDRPGIEQVVEFAQQRPLSHIGFDTDVGYRHPGADLQTIKTYDPKSLVPFLLSLSMVEPQGFDSCQMYNFVIDLRNNENIRLLQPLFHLPVCFVSHSIKDKLFCLWMLGLYAPNIVWDTYIHEKALHLGKNHKKYRLKGPMDDVYQQIKASEEKAEADKFMYSLLATCQRYGVPYGVHILPIDPGSKLPISQGQLDYAIQDAKAAARLYLPQVITATQHGILHHLLTVEMPWIITNAKIQWKGVRIDCDKRDETIGTLQVHKNIFEKKFARHRLDNPRSQEQLITFFEHLGLLHLFTTATGYTFDKYLLKRLQTCHPAIEEIRNYRRIMELLDDKILNPELVGKDGRIHPEHIQLGTDTGRQTSTEPNILGMDRLLRFLIIPESGYGIGEVDWSQHEVGIAAAVYDDDALIEMYNSGDVYTAMVRRFFAKEISPDAALLTDQEFKQRYHKFRKIIKECTLGIFYGMTPYGLAKKLNIPEWRAKRLQQQFFEMFPCLSQQLNTQPRLSAIRGYAATISGLRRNRGQEGSPNSWELNWLSNHPVQGSAAVVFKVAGNRLVKLYEIYDAHLIVPLHDSFVFEAPLEHLQFVAKMTKRVMCETVREYFPKLKPMAEINMSNPDCWNKDDDPDPIGKWLKSITNHIKEPLPS